MTSSPRHSPSRPPRIPSHESGFTLIELGLVLLIIGVVLALTIPRLRDRSHAELLSQARRMAVTFRFLRRRPS